MDNITDTGFELLRAYIKENFGISLGEEKKSLVYSRIRGILQDNNFNNFMEYYSYLMKDQTGQAMVAFVNKITTNHTFFMRETAHFDFFRDLVLPYINDTSKNQDLRLWCAGCSSGEEPYTLQMIIQDYFKPKLRKWNTQILATDISTDVLDKAIKGIYSADHMDSLPEKWRDTYFKKLDPTRYEVINSLKSEILYRKFNLMNKVFPFKKPLQVIFCRNVMIYFDSETRNELVERFYRATEPGGYLFIGHAESLNNTGTKYKYIMPAVYRKP